MYCTLSTRRLLKTLSAQPCSVLDPNVFGPLEMTSSVRAHLSGAFALETSLNMLPGQQESRTTKFMTVPFILMKTASTFERLISTR